MRIPVELKEWETLSPEPGSALHSKHLGQDSADLELAEKLSKSNVLRIVDVHNKGLWLQSFSYVGRLRLGNLSITIRPKIEGMPLLRLLRYAYGLRDLKLLPDTEFQIADSAFQDILLHQLAQEASELVARGLHRRYVRRNAALASPRGRIDFQQFVRQKGLTTSATLPCTYHPRLQDCLINQVLLKGLYLGASLTDDPRLKRRLAGLIIQIRENVSAIDRLDQNVMRRLRRRSSRLTVAYEPSIAIIQMLLDAKGIYFESTDQRIELPGFLFDMNLFFQALLGRFLRENLPNCVVMEQFRLKNVMGFYASYNPMRRRDPTPRPDYAVSRNGKPMALLDAKYRDLWANPPTANMLYQLAIYALTRGQDGSATILYPALHERREQRIWVRNPIDGSGRGQVIIRAVNLSRLEKYVTEPNTAQARRNRTRYAQLLAFGSC
ncbi:MAG TPA: restriction endonuclease [bacterium]|nr:restriction endonuclease [bacterium]